MPVMEANIMGVPTIASDIAAHREVANATTTLLPTDDEAAWERAIMALPCAPHRHRPVVPPEVSEAAYCSDLLHFLNDIASGKTLSQQHPT